MRRIFSLFAVLAISVFVLNGFVAEAMKQDSFYIRAAQSDMLEIMSSNLALQKSQNEEVRRFAQMMIDDHTRTSNELKTLAASKNVTLPTTMSNKQQSAMDKLNRAAAGADFDREYMKMQVKAHEDAVKLFQRQANEDEADEADAKAFAAKTLPALQTHLATARTLNNTVKNAGRGNDGGTEGNTNTGGNRNGNMNMNMNSNTNTNTNTNSNANANTNSNVNGM
jgi:putative membrane protein